MMRSDDRQRLKDLRFAPEVIASTEQVLHVWEVEQVFVDCSYCGRSCLNPALHRGQYRRKKLPADLFLRRELLGFRDDFGEVICWTCDEEQFQ